MPAPKFPHGLQSVKAECIAQTIVVIGTDAGRNCELYRYAANDGCACPTAIITNRIVASADRGHRFRRATG